MATSQNWTVERLDTSIFSETTIEHLHRYAVVLDFVGNKKVLDLASGEGYGTNLISKKAKQAIGLDINKEAIEKSRAKYKSNNIEFHIGNAEKMPFQNKEFDVIVCFETIEHVDNPNILLSEIKRVLCPGGLLIISTPNKKIYSDKTGYNNIFHKKEFYEAEFFSILQKNFKYIQLNKQLNNSYSLIHSTLNTQFEFFSGDFNQIGKCTVPEAMFFIAFASDNNLPLINSSLFNSQSIIEKAVLEKEKAIKQSYSYRIGNFILYPFKVIRNFFRE